MAETMWWLVFLYCFIKFVSIYSSTAVYTDEAKYMQIYSKYQLLMTLNLWKAIVYLIIPEFQLHWLLWTKAEKTLTQEFSNYCQYFLLFGMKMVDSLYLWEQDGFYLFVLSLPSWVPSKLPTFSHYVRILHILKN